MGFDSQDEVCLFFEVEELFNAAISVATASQMKYGANILAYVSRSQQE